MPDAAPRRILLIKTHAIGDVLLATPALRATRALYPDAHMTLMVGKWSYPVVRHNPHLDDCIVFDEKVFFEKKLAGMWRLLRDLRARRFDLAIVLHPSPLLHLFALLAGIPRRIGLQRGKPSPFLSSGVMEDYAPGFYYPRNFLSLVGLLGAHGCDTALEAPFASSDLESARLLALAHGLDLSRPFWLMAPGGARNPKESVLAKLWPSEYYQQLTALMRARWPEVPIVLSGGPGDAEACARVASASPGVVDLCGQTSLETLLALVAHAGAVVCNDSSMLHMAVAHRRDIFCFFGPTSAGNLAPENPYVHVLRSGASCSPCFRYAIFDGCAHDHRCMRELSPAHVLASIEAVLPDGPRPGLVD